MATQISVYELTTRLYRVQTFTETSQVTLDTFATEGWQNITVGDGNRVAITIQNASSAGNVVYQVGETLTGGDSSVGFTLTPGQSYSVTAIFDFDAPADMIRGYGSVADVVVIIQKTIITPSEFY